VSDLDGAATWAAGEVRGGRALHRLVAELGAERRESLRRVALVVLRPHALEAGDGAAIVRHLAVELGVRPVAIRVYPRLEPALVGALYARQLKIPRERLWLQEAAFGAGPAAALLVTCDKAPEPSLTARLYACKGPSSTLERAPDSLRGRFHRTSSLHAVLHVPDDLRALVIEASLFFSWETIARAACAHALTPGLVEELVTLEPLPGRVVYQAVLKVKRRILAAVATASRDDAVARLWILTAAADERLDGRPYHEQRELMLAFAKAERAPLAEAIAGLEARGGGPAALRAGVAPGQLLSASWFLSGHETYDVDGGGRLFAALEAGGVPLSASQRSLLATALTTDLHPAARVAGERLWPLGPDPAA
jgi:hypothetical protein